MGNTNHPETGEASPARQDIRGILKKESDHLKNKNERYFVLQHQTLAYWRDEADHARSRSRGSMRLDTAHLVERGAFGFDVVSHDGTTWQLEAGNPREAERWKTALRLAMRPMWVPDGEAPRCTICANNFSAMNRRHHCRKCGHAVCGACSSGVARIPEYLYPDPVRVCDPCRAGSAGAGGTGERKAPEEARPDPHEEERRARAALDDREARRREFLEKKRREREAGGSGRASAVRDKYRR